MKRLKKAALIVSLSLFIPGMGYAESDSETITVHMRVLPIASVEFGEEAFDMEIVDGSNRINSNSTSNSTDQNDPSDMVVRTTVVGGRTYQEISPLE